MNNLNNGEKTPPGIRFSRRWFWLLPTLLVLALGIPMADCYLHGNRLSEVVGEITAYRYFYSLRMIHGEYPWVPNGHTIGLAFEYINRALSFVGFAETNLYPRIDIALVSFNLTSFLASAWLLWRLRRRFPNDLWLCALAAASLATLYQERLLSGQFTVVPDYPNLIFPIALATLLLTPVTVPTRLWLHTITLALFGGLLIATKLTFVSFFGFAAIWFLFLIPRWPQRILHAGVLAVAPLLIAFAILFCYHGFHWAPTQFNLRFILDFIQHSQVAKPVPYREWLTTTLTEHWRSGSYVGLCAVLTPFIAMIGLGFRQARPWAAFTLICSAVQHALIFKRSHIFSFIEPNFFLLISIAYLLVLLARSPAWARTRYAVALPALCSCVFLGWWLWLLPQGLQRTRNRIDECNLTGRQIASFVNSTPGRTLYLIPNNSYNVPSLDNAISKGGTDMHSNTWGDSPFMTTLFPDRTYLFGYSALGSPYDLKPYAKILTTILHGNEQETFDQLKSQFQVELSDYERRFSHTINPSVKVVGYVRKQPQTAQTGQLFRLLPTASLAPALYLSPRELKGSCTLVLEPQPHWRVVAEEAGPYLALCYGAPLHLPAGATLRVRANVGAALSGKLLIQATLRPEGATVSKTVGREATLNPGQNGELSLLVSLDHDTLVESVSVGILKPDKGSSFQIFSIEAESVIYKATDHPAEPPATSKE